MRRRYLPYYIVLIACFASLLVGCSQDELVSPAKSGEPIRFGIEEFQTKTFFLTDSSVVSLGVFGYSTAKDTFNIATPSHIPNLFYNRKATRTLTSEKVLTDWLYEAPAVYWPIDTAVRNTFFAYAPHSSDFPAVANLQISGEAASGYPTLTYTTPQKGSEQVDILYAVPVKNTNRHANNGEVLYQMKHAMGWIALLAAPIKLLNDTITETYTITNMYCSATGITTTGILNLGTGTWTGLQSSSVEFRFTPSATPIEAGKFGRVVSEEDRLMVIPQQITRANDTMLHMSFKYDDGDEIKDEDENELVEYFYSVPFPETRLSAGKIVMYVVRMSIEGINIEFHEENTIEEWIAATEKPEIDIY